MTSISVALCTYNGEKYLSKQLESILSQTIVPDEIIICDDNSQDETEHILKEYSDKYPNIIKIFTNDSNLGVTKNFEKAISHCNGDLILLSDQDDYWHKTKVKKQIQAYKKKTPSLICHDSYVVSDTSKPIDQHHSGNTLWTSLSGNHEPLSATNSKTAFDELLRRNFVQGATILIERDFVESILPIPHFWNHDYYFAVMAALAGTIYDMGDILLSYRQHSNQEVGVKKTIKSKLINEMKKDKDFYRRRACAWNNLLKRVDDNNNINLNMDREYITNELYKKHVFMLKRYNLNSGEISTLSGVSAIFWQLFSRRYSKYGHIGMSIIDVLTLLKNRITDSR